MLTEKNRFLSPPYSIAFFLKDRPVKILTYSTTTSSPSASLHEWRRPLHVVNDWSLSSPIMADRIELHLDPQAQEWTPIYLVQFTATGGHGNSAHYKDLIAQSPSIPQTYCLDYSPRSDGWRTPLFAGNQAFERGLAISSKTSVTFPIPEKALRFTASVGFTKVKDIPKGSSTTLHILLNHIHVQEVVIKSDSINSIPLSTPVNGESKITLQSQSPDALLQRTSCILGIGNPLFELP